MTTLVQPTSGTRTGLVLAWSFTVMAILAIGLVVATAPLPQLSAAATSGAPVITAEPTASPPDA